MINIEKTRNSKEKVNIVLVL